MLASAHLPAMLTIPLGGLAMLLLFWYWMRLGSACVPESRRRIRRASLLAMFVGVIVLVRAFSFVDDQADPSGYAVTWAVAILLILLVVFLAFIDVLNNLRIHRLARSAEIDESRARLRQAVLDARAPADEA